MDEYKTNSELTTTFKAICDPTRRSLLTMLVQQGPMRVTELATHYEMSLNSISKHIKVLESAGLIKRKTKGRVHIIQAVPNGLDCIESWLKSFKSLWEIRLDKLADLLEKETNYDKH